MPLSKASNSTDPAIVWSNLRRNHILYDHLDGASVGAQVIAKAKGIIDKPRHSIMSEEEQTSVKDTIKRSKFKGETTCIIETLQVLLRTTQERLSDHEAEKWVLSAWDKDGLAKAWQTQFNTSAIPQLDNQDDDWKTVPRVKTPYPDVLYAYEGDYMAPALLEALDDFALFLAKEMHLPFLSLDGKGVLHGIEEAETQCARTGSALVSHLIQFLEFASARCAKAEKALETHATLSSATTSEPPAPPPAFAFTIAFCPSKVHLFVHFAEIRMEKPTRYHMHDVGSYDFKKGEDIRLLRKHINNILDWGLGSRKAEFERYCQSLADSLRLAKKRKARGKSW